MENEAVETDIPHTCGNVDQYEKSRRLEPFLSLSKISHKTPPSTKYSHAIFASKTYNKVFSPDAFYFLRSKGSINLDLIFVAYFRKLLFYIR